MLTLQDIARLEETVKTQAAWIAMLEQLVLQQQDRLLDFGVVDLEVNNE